MAFRLPSVQNEYDEYSPYDPAFVQLDENASDDEKAKYRERVRRCRETGNWTELLAEPSLVPTKFVMRPLPGDVFRSLMDLIQTGRLGISQYPAMFFRAAIKRVCGLGDSTIDAKPTTEPGIPGKIANVEIPNLLDAFRSEIVTELGDEVLRRASQPSPRH